MSAENKKELEEIPAEIRKNLTIHQVSYADEVLKLALVGKAKSSPLKFSDRALGTAAKKKKRTNKDLLI